MYVSWAVDCQPYVSRRTSHAKPTGLLVTLYIIVPGLLRRHVHVHRTLACLAAGPHLILCGAKRIL